MIDYTRPTPETDAFMTLIDDSQIDLEQVRAKLHDMEIQRDHERARAERHAHKACAGYRVCATLKELSTWECQGEPLNEAYDAVKGAGAWDKLIKDAQARCNLPAVICLCGSTRFRAEIAEANRVETMEGRIVLAPGVFGHSGDPITDEDKARLDRLHFTKIALADEVLVVNPGGYIGESTAREIDYATSLGIPVAYTSLCEKTGSSTVEPRVIRASIRDADDELHIECRFSDGQKFATVRVDSGFPELATKLANYLNATGSVTEAVTH